MPLNSSDIIYMHTAAHMHTFVSVYASSCSAIEDEYDGPKLEDGKVTVQFTHGLMEAYKAQKKLHRKYGYEVTNVLLIDVCLLFYR